MAARDDEMMEAESSQLQSSGRSRRKMHTLVRISEAKSEALNLFPGENWLCFCGGDDESLEKPSIYNLQENNGSLPTDDPSLVAFLAVDVDGSLASIKDMRQPFDSDYTEIQIGINRIGNASNLELERRRLVHLNHRDEIRIHQPRQPAIILEYHHDVVDHLDASEAESSLSVVETETETDASKDKSTTSILNTSILKSTIADQLVTQPEQPSGHEAALIDAPVSSEPNDKASQPVHAIIKAPASASHSENHFSDDETVDPDDIEGPLRTEHDDELDMPVGDADINRADKGDREKTQESQATSVYSPPQDTMGETEPILAASAPKMDQSDRLSFVDDEEASASIQSAPLNRHLPDQPSHIESLDEIPESVRAASGIVRTGEAVDSDAETEDDADVSPPDNVVGPFKHDDADAETDDEVEAVANNTESLTDIDPSSEHHARGGESVDPQQGGRQHNEKPAVSDNIAPAMEISSRLQNPIPLAEALIQATRTTTPRVAATFNYDYAASFDEDDSHIQGTNAPTSQQEEVAHPSGDNARAKPNSALKLDKAMGEVRGTMEDTRESSDNETDDDSDDKSEPKTRSSRSSSSKAKTTAREQVTKSIKSSELSLRQQAARNVPAKGTKSSGSTMRKQAARNIPTSRSSNARNKQATESDADTINSVEPDASPRLAKKRAGVEVSATPASTRPQRKRKDTVMDDSIETSSITRSASKKAKRSSEASTSSHIRILVTKIQLTPSQLKLVEKIPNARWIEETEEAHLATHVIASDGNKQPLKRTPKLMIAMNNTPNIVSLEWLVESAKKRAALPCERFIVHDKKAEREYGFSMKETVARIRQHLENGTSVLADRQVYICKGVAGNEAPKEVELKCIVEAAGGRWKSNLKSVAAADMADLLVITSSDSAEEAKQRSVAAVTSAIKRGAVCKTTKWLFDGIMAQELDF